VTLEGEVDHWYQSEDAEQAVRYMAGVSAVTNRIVVRGPQVDPDQLRAEIEQALERRAERAAGRIDIRVVDGTVRLSGPVRSRGEKQAILCTVRHAPGVRAIEDRLRIEPVA
jgi:osmotically-inducible protein OsmY